MESKKTKRVVNAENTTNADGVAMKNVNLLYGIDNCRPKAVRYQRSE